MGNVVIIGEKPVLLVTPRSSTAGFRRKLNRLLCDITAMYNLPLTGKDYAIETVRQAITSAYDSNKVVESEVSERYRNMIMHLKDGLPRPKKMRRDLQMRLNKQ